MDIYLGEDGEEDDADDEDEDEEDENGVQEFFKTRWNLNASFRNAPGSSGLRPESFDLINSLPITLFPPITIEPL